MGIAIFHPLVSTRKKRDKLYSVAGFFLFYHFSLEESSCDVSQLICNIRYHMFPIYTGKVFILKSDWDIFGLVQNHRSGHEVLFEEMQ